mgnify:CR=1 FL=1
MAGIFGCKRDVDIEVCTCVGHVNGHKNLRHFMACCAGECVCGKPIRSMFLEQHRAHCEQFKLASPKQP